MSKGDAKEGYLNTTAHLEAKVAMLDRALAESQARSVRMVELMRKLREPDWHIESIREFQCELTALEDTAMSDDSALREMIAAEREACASFVEHCCAGNQMADPRELKEVADAIRARDGRQV